MATSSEKPFVFNGGVVRQLGDHSHVDANDVGQPKPAEASAHAAPGVPQTDLPSNAAASQAATDRLARRAFIRLWLSKPDQLPPIPSDECLLQQQMREKATAKAALYRAAIAQAKKPPAEDDPNMDPCMREFVALYRRPTSEVFEKPSIFPLGANKRGAEAGGHSEVQIPCSKKRRTATAS